MPPFISGFMSNQPVIPELVIRTPRISSALGFFCLLFPLIVLLAIDHSNNRTFMTQLGNYRAWVRIVDLILLVGCANNLKQLISPTKLLAVEDLGLFIGGRRRSQILVSWHLVLDAKCTSLTVYQGANGKFERPAVEVILDRSVDLTCVDDLSIRRRSPTSILVEEAVLGSISADALVHAIRCRLAGDSRSSQDTTGTAG